MACLAVEVRLAFQLDLRFCSLLVRCWDQDRWADSEREGLSRPASGEHHWTTQAGKAQSRMEEVHTLRYLSKGYLGPSGSRVDPAQLFLVYSVCHLSAETPSTHPLRRCNQSLSEPVWQERFSSGPLDC